MVSSSHLYCFRFIFRKHYQPLATSSPSTTSAYSTIMTDKVTVMCPRTLTTYYTASQWYHGNVVQEYVTKPYINVQYHDKASSYIGMSMKASSDLSEIYISLRGLSQRIIDDFFLMIIPRKLLQPRPISLTRFLTISPLIVSSSCQS